VKWLLYHGKNTNNDRHMQLDASYYISRVLIPPLERVFNLVGADVRSWFDDMPKAIRTNDPNPLSMSPKKQKLTENRFKIDEHFRSSQCLACGSSSSDGRYSYDIVLQGLTSRPQESAMSVEEHLKKQCLSCWNEYEREKVDFWKHSGFVHRAHPLQTLSRLNASILTAIGCLTERRQKGKQRFSRD